MIKRKKYTREAKKKLVLELISGENSGAKIAQREGLAYQTLKKWEIAFENNGLENSDEERIRLLQENKELRHVIADITLENHLLKKAEKIIFQMKRRGEL